MAVIGDISLCEACMSSALDMAVTTQCHPSYQDQTTNWTHGAPGKEQANAFKSRDPPRLISSIPGLEAQHGQFSTRVSKPTLSRPVFQRKDEPRWKNPPGRERRRHIRRRDLYKARPFWGMDVDFGGRGTPAPVTAIPPLSSTRGLPWQKGRPLILWIQVAPVKDKRQPNPLARLSRA